MTTTRMIRKVLKAKPTLEGAGVHLKRVFGFSEVPQFDPFLLLDDFRSDNPGALSQGVSLAPAPGHRDHHLCAQRRCGARRQHGQPGRHRLRAMCNG